MANNFLRQLFGMGGTEPSYAGLRVPRQMMQDDSRLIRQTNPQERFRDYHAQETLAPLSEEDKVAIQGGSMDAPLVETEEQKAKSKRQKQDMIRGIGSDLASMFAQSQEPTKPLQFAQLQQQQLIPLIDPRFRRAKGGKVKKGQPYLVGEEGAEIVVPTEDGEVVSNEETRQVLNPVDTTAVDEEARKLGGQRVDWSQIAEEPINVQATEQVTPDSVTETVTEEPSIADLLRQKIDVRQKRLAEGATKNPDGTTTYGGQKYRKRNALDALKSAGLGALQSLANMQVNPNDPNPLSSMFGRAIGGAGAGAVMGATMNNVDERMVDKMKLAQLLPQYQQAYGMERQKKADDLQAENTRADNEINKIRIESAITAKADSEKGKAVVALNKLKWFDPKNATHAALAKRAGLDVTELQGWDDRRPFTKNVAGVEYIYKDGVFTPSNLPIDEAKTLKDYTVEMPNGEKRTYRVSQKDAANFSTQMSALGAKLAQQDRQFQQRLVLDKAKFDQAKKEFETQTMLRQQAFTAMEAARATGDMQKAQQYQLDLDKYDAMLQKMRQAALEAKTKGELDETQFGELDKFFQK